MKSWGIFKFIDFRNDSNSTRAMRESCPNSCPYKYCHTFTRKHFLKHDCMSVGGLLHATYSSLITATFYNMCLMRLWYKPISHVCLGIVGKKIWDYSSVNDYNIAVCKQGFENREKTEYSKGSGTWQCPKEKLLWGLEETISCRTEFIQNLFNKAGLIGYLYSLLHSS